MRKGITNETWAILLAIVLLMGVLYAAYRGAHGVATSNVTGGIFSLVP